MLIVETIRRIRRAHLDKGKSIKGIARELHLSHNTIRRVLRSGETAFSYEREVQPRPRLGRWTGDPDRLLAANAKARQAKSAFSRSCGPSAMMALRRGSPICASVEQGVRERDGGRLRAADVCAGRSLTVRLEAMRSSSWTA
jgi:hypothetical protein